MKKKKVSQKAKRTQGVYKGLSGRDTNYLKQSIKYGHLKG